MAASTATINNPITKDGVSSSTSTNKELGRGTYIGLLAVFATVLIHSSKDAVFQYLDQSSNGVVDAYRAMCLQYAVSLAIFFPFYWRDLKIVELRKIPRKVFIKLIVAEGLNRVFGLLLNIAAETINLQLMFILTNMQAVWVILLGYYVLNKQISKWNGTSSFIIFTGVIVALFIRLLFGSAITFGSDTVLVLVGGLGYAATNVIDLTAVKSAPFGTVLLFKQILGVVIYHSILIGKEGVAGLAQVYGVGVWGSMWWYVLLYGPIASVIWLVALKQGSITLMAVRSSGVFICSIIWAIAVTATYPSPSQSIAAAFVIVALVINIVHIFKVDASKQPASKHSEASTLALQRQASSSHPPFPSEEGGQEQKGGVEEAKMLELA